MAYDSGHRGNVFQARAIPGSSLTTIVSCAADGQVSKVTASRWRNYKTLDPGQEGRGTRVPLENVKGYLFRVALVGKPTGVVRMSLL